MDTDLHKVIRSPQPLSDQHVQYFLYQLLRGMKYIHSCNVLHRDLKPSNLLVNENCDLKITDFGLSRGVNPSDSLDFLTEYVVTRWYRAPEIVLSSDTYTKAVDVWSCGCIFAELLGRKPLFPGASSRPGRAASRRPGSSPPLARAGSDHVQQLNCILAVIGTPQQSQLSHVPPKARQYIAALPPTPGKPLSQIYPAATAPAIELLAHMLHWEPSKRCTIEEALANPYLAAFHNPAAEPVAATLFDFDLQEELEPKMALFREVCRFRPELAAHATQIYSDQQRAKRSRQQARGLAAPDAAAEAENLPRYGEQQQRQQPQPPAAQIAEPASV